MTIYLLTIYDWVAQNVIVFDLRSTIYNLLEDKLFATNSTNFTNLCDGETKVSQCNPQRVAMENNVESLI